MPHTNTTTSAATSTQLARPSASARRPKLLGMVSEDAQLVGAWLGSAIDQRSGSVVAAALDCCHQRVSQWRGGSLPPMSTLPALLRIPGVGRELARQVVEYATAAPKSGLDARDALGLVVEALSPVATAVREATHPQGPAGSAFSADERRAVTAVLLKLRDRVDAMLRDLAT